MPCTQFFIQFLLSLSLSLRILRLAVGIICNRSGDLPRNLAQVARFVEVLALEGRTGGAMGRVRRPEILF